VRRIDAEGKVNSMAMRTKEEIMAVLSNPHDQTMVEVLVDIRDVLLEVGCAIERAMLLPYQQEETAEEQSATEVQCYQCVDEAHETAVRQCAVHGTAGTVEHADVPQDTKPEGTVE
jgi:hypothetical protein